MNKSESRFSFRPIKWLHFVNEVHPIFPNITFSYLSFISFYAFVLNFLKIGVFSWTDLIIGATAYSATLLCLRAIDELKDQETDIINFPDRPLVKGVVARSDLYSLSALILSLGAVVHLLVYQISLPFISYICVSLYAFVVYKWFFIENFLKSRLSWTFLSHNPIFYVLQFYCLSFLFISLKDPLGRESLFITLAFGATGTAWEISRKIKQPQEESEYMTYTKIWGQDLSAYLILIGLYTSVSCFTYISSLSLAEHPKWMVIPLLTPILTLMHVTWQVKVFRSGRIRGALIRENVELYIGTLTLTALVLGLLPLL